MIFDSYYVREVRPVTLNTIPRGTLMVLKDKFYVFTPDGQFRVFGNRLKLKRFWKRHGRSHGLPPMNAA